MTIDLTTLADVRALGQWDVTDTTDDALLTRYITSYSKEFERALDRHTEATTYTEVYTLRQGEKVVTLKGAPASAVTTVKYSFDQDWANATALTVTSDYIAELDEATVRLLFTTSYRPGFVQVVYDGGMAANTAAFATAHPDISEACAMQAMYHWTRHHSPGGNVVVQGGSTTYDGELRILKGAQNTLDRYRRWYL